MKTDTSKVLQNKQVGRTTFNLSSTLKTTTRFGSVDPISCKFVLPMDTISNSDDCYVELKPTVDKLNTTIASNISNYFVPMNKVWHYADNFISKKGEFVANGGVNLTEIEGNNAKPVTMLPAFRRHGLYGYFLSCLGPVVDENNEIVNINAKLTSSVQSAPSMGNTCLYDFGFVDINGNYHPSFASWNNVSKQSITNTIGWWMPRLIGDGWNLETQSQRNLNISADGTNIYMIYHTNESDVVNFFNYTHRIVNPTWKDVTVVKISYWYSVANKRINFRLDGANDLCTAPSTSPASSYYFYVNVNESSSTQRFGEVKVLSVSSESNSWLYQMNYYCTLLAFFGNSQMLGKGSLMESMGLPMFKYGYYHEMLPTIEDIGAGSYSVGQKGWVPMYTENLGSSESYATPNVCILPFYAYQTIISEKFLLPHEVLSNNPNQDGTISSDRMDSAVYRNYLVPTECFEYSPYWLTNILEGGLTQSNLVVGSGIEPSTERLQCAVHLNQYLTLFLGRAGLIDTDFYTRMHQKENHLVQNVQSDKGIAVVDSINFNLNVRKYLLARRLDKKIRFGGKDQSAQDFIENQYGLQGALDDPFKVMNLSNDQQIIGTEDVVNVAASEEVALGKKATIASITKPNRAYYEFFAKSYGWIIGVHYLTCCNEYFDTVNCDVLKLGTSNVAANFGLREQFDTAFLPVYADCGDDPMYSTDLDGTSTPQIVGYQPKNFWLKDSPNIVRGDYGDLYRGQIITPTDPIVNREELSLTYDYLQKSPAHFTSHFVDRGDNVLLNIKHNMYRQSTQTKLNSVGLTE